MRTVTLSCLALILLTYSCKDDEPVLSCEPTFQAGDTACHDYFGNLWSDLTTSPFDAVGDSLGDPYPMAWLSEFIDLNEDGTDDIEIRVVQQYDGSVNQSRWLSVYCWTLDSAFNVAVDSLDLARSFRAGENITSGLQYKSDARIFYYSNFPIYLEGNYASDEGYLVIREQRDANTSFYWLYFPEGVRELDSFSGWKQ